jgi:hypothetical protein
MSDPALSARCRMDVIHTMSAFGHGIWLLRSFCDACAIRRFTAKEQS